MSEETRQKTTEELEECCMVWGESVDAVNALTAHIMDEVRGVVSAEVVAYVKAAVDDTDKAINRLQAAKDALAPPAAERMSEERLAYWRRSTMHQVNRYPLHELVAEAARAREAEALLDSTVASLMDDLESKTKRVDQLKSDREEMIRECARRDYRIAELERDAKNRCDECGSKLIDNCGVCGAPTCCPSCCRVNTKEMVIEKKNHRIAELEATERRQVEIIAEQNSARSQLERSNAAYRDSWKACMNELCDCDQKLRDRVRVLENLLADDAEVAKVRRDIESDLESANAQLATARALLERATPTECHCDLEVNYKCEWCCRVEAFLAGKEGE